MNSIEQTAAAESFTATSIAEQETKNVIVSSSSDLIVDTQEASLPDLVMYSSRNQQKMKEILTTNSEQTLPIALDIAPIMSISDTPRPLIDPSSAMVNFLLSTRWPLFFSN